MKQVLLLSLLAIGCGEDDNTNRNIETVTTNPVQAQCEYYVTARYYNYYTNITSCHYAYRCNGEGFKVNYSGNVWCGR